MLVGGKCVFIASRVDERDGRKYASCSLENNDSIVQVNVAERLISVLESLEKYRGYMCTFEYDRVNTQKGNFTVFRLCGITEAAK